ncbi:MAG: helix-turn-helix domain-containing protein [Thermoprotei archaeon]
MGKAESALMELGLSLYEANALAALYRLGSATPKLVAQNSNVPGTWVHSVFKSLEKKGLVVCVQSGPKVYEPVPVDKVASTLESEALKRLRENRKILRELAKGGLDEWTRVHAVVALGEREISAAAEREFRRAGRVLAATSTRGRIARGLVKGAAGRRWDDLGLSVIVARDKVLLVFEPRRGRPVGLLAYSSKIAAAAGAS